MTKVYCADSSCSFCNDNGVCTQKKIGLAWLSVQTVREGRQEYNKCRMYQKSDIAKQIGEKMKPFFTEGR
jgi:hypothetical protein